MRIMSDTSLAVKQPEDTNKPVVHATITPASRPTSSSIISFSPGQPLSWDDPHPQTTVSNQAHFVMKPVELTEDNPYVVIHRTAGGNVGFHTNMPQKFAIAIGILLIIAIGGPGVSPIINTLIQLLTNPGLPGIK